MTGENPNFEDPPVVERVLSVQFEPLAGFTAAHAGCFWKERLCKEFPNVVEAARIDDEYERFEPGKTPSFRRPRFMIRPTPGQLRTQLISSDGDRLFQLQDTRFIYNWRRQSSTNAYPRYEAVFQSFETEFGKFCEFAKALGLGDVVPNQWEVTYVNHLEKGKDWNSMADWPKVIGGFHVPVSNSSQVFESFGGEWHLVLEENRGRLHVTINHGQLDSGNEMLLLQLTARGPFSDISKGLKADFDFGHDQIIDSFSKITTSEAQKNWGKV